MRQKSGPEKQPAEDAGLGNEVCQRPVLNFSGFPGKLSRPGAEAAGGETQGYLDRECGRQWDRRQRHSEKYALEPANHIASSMTLLWRCASRSGRRARRRDRRQDLWLRQIHPRQQAQSEARAEPPAGTAPIPHPNIRGALLQLVRSGRENSLARARSTAMTGS
jgi:hypothetical protein